VTINRSIRLFCWAFLISFMGSLPVGTLNVSVADLSINMGAAAAVQFGIGAMLVEVLVVRIALVTVRKLEGLHTLLRFFKGLTCAIILLVAALSLEAAWHMRKPGVAIPFAGHMPFVSGLLLSLINPLHLPFWMGWTAVLKSRKTLTDSRSDYNLFVIAIGCGTSLAFLTYGIAGTLLIMFLRMNQNLFNWLVGLALLVTGLVQLWQLFVRNRTVVPGHADVMSSL
jgi:threonine/homoserine/homoserine lactone efflux protein